MKNQVTLRMQSYCRGKDSKPLTSCADMFKVCQQSSLRPAGHRHAAVGGTACSWILALCEVAHTDTRHAWCHAPNYKTCRCARDTVKRLRDNSTQLAAVHVQSASKQLTGVIVLEMTDVVGCCAIAQRDTEGMQHIVVPNHAQILSIAVNTHKGRQVYG